MALELMTLRAVGATCSTPPLEPAKRKNTSVGPQTLPVLGLKVEVSSQRLCVAENFDKKYVFHRLKESVCVAETFDKKKIQISLIERGCMCSRKF